MLLVIILMIVCVIKKFHVYVLLLYFLAVYDSLSLSLSRWSECMCGHVIVFLYSSILNVKHISYVTVSI